eukprot:29654_5
MEDLRLNSAGRELVPTCTFDAYEALAKACAAGDASAAFWVAACISVLGCSLSLLSIDIIFVPDLLVEARRSKSQPWPLLPDRTRPKSEDSTRRMLLLTWALPPEATRTISWFVWRM